MSAKSLTLSPVSLQLLPCLTLVSATTYGTADAEHLLRQKRRTLIANLPLKLKPLLPMAIIAPLLHRPAVVLKHLLVPPLPFSSRP